MSALAYIGLGSSLGDRLETLRSAVRALASHPDIDVTEVSRIYETRPVGGEAERRFLNAAIGVQTPLEPAALLDALLSIERAHGRERSVRWSDRTLDLDLLVVVREGESASLSTSALTLPHPEITMRDFVLAPLCDLAPDLEIRGQTIREWLDRMAEGQRSVEAVVLGTLR